MMPNLPSIESLDAAAARDAALLRWGFDDAPDTILFADADGIIVRANRQAQFLFGIPIERLVGATVESLMPERYRAKHAEYRSRYIINPQPRPMGRRTIPLFVLRGTDEIAVSISLNASFVLGAVFVIIIIRRVESDPAHGGD